jgi:hypothetical protein
MRTQEELDRVIRQAKGHRAVEEMLSDGPKFQLYKLDDGSFLRISKMTGAVAINPTPVNHWEAIVFAGRARS